MLSFVESIQLLALRAVHTKKSTSDYNKRKIFRWYSEKFHTPLHEVEALPLEDIFTHFYECMFENMTEEERLKESRLLLLTEEERKAEAKNEDELDAEGFELIEMEKETKKALGKSPEPFPEDISLDFDVDCGTPLDLSGFGLG